MQNANCESNPFRESQNDSLKQRLAAPAVRIAQVAPLYESVPPRYYGGTERMVSYLGGELVAQGHDVTLHSERRLRDEGDARPGVPALAAARSRIASTSSRITS